MINPEDETVIDSRQSVTVEECVAKMLGWMQGAIRLRNPKLDQWGVLPEDLPHLKELEYPLDAHLYHLRERARNELLDAVESGQADEVIWAKDDEVNYWTGQSEKAAQYLSAIVDEVNKGGTSSLIIDESQTANANGNVHITLSSLEQWARNLGNCLENFYGPRLSDTSSTQKAKRSNALKEELECVLESMYQSNQRITASKVMAVLRQKAGTATSCITANVGDGLQWENDLGRVKKLTISALDERIRAWRENRKNQD